MNHYLAPDFPKKTEREVLHAGIARQAAAEGIVLLENNGCLPLRGDERIALFGSGARNTLFCGLGAASMNPRSAVSIEEGLRQAGFSITTDGYLTRFAAVQSEAEEAYYQALRQNHEGELLQAVLDMYAHPYLPAELEPITKADLAGEPELAVYVISRCSGEGADRQNVPGDYQLSEDEKRDLAFLDENFSQIVVLLNTVGVIDTRFLRGLEHLGAMLFIGLGGMEAGNAAADVLTGKTPPQGKLTATWAERYEDYPNALHYAGNDGDLDDEYYSEGIYIGYRYFDAAGIRPAYPFGYGKSYAKFSIRFLSCEQSGEHLTVQALVQNDSEEYSGREVVQAYIAPPQTGMPKPVKSLAGFAKTALLAPGQCETLNIELDSKSMASYDTASASWVMEAGDHLLLLGNSSADTQPVGAIRCPRTLVLEHCRNLFPPDEPIAEWQPHPFERSARDKVALENVLLTLNTGAFRTLVHQYPAEEAPLPHSDAKGPLCFADVRAGRATAEELTAQLPPEALATLCVGNLPETDGPVSRADVMAAGTAANRRIQTDITETIVPGASETTAASQREWGIPKLNLLDGGSGLRLVPEFETDAEGNLLTSGLYSIRNVDRITGKQRGCHEYPGSRLFYQYTTALPMATLLAQSWDPDLLLRCAEMIRSEAEAFGVDIWLAPSMNLHRNPLCGRNFEYYSEDPLLTGVCASSMVHGVEQGHRVATAIKHFACNNQEANRNAVNAHVSERALRELYLRGFEYVLRREKPSCVMTALNLINGTHAANSRALLVDYLRGENGFDGFVMTDWGTTVEDPAEHNKYRCASPAGCIQAGNDLIMPGTTGDRDALLAVLQNGTLSLAELQRCAANILQVMLRLERAKG